MCVLDVHPNIWLGCTNFRRAGVFSRSLIVVCHGFCLVSSTLGWKQVLAAGIQGCWPTWPHNSSQVRKTCGCQMCWAACDFCPYTVSLWAKKPNLPNICQVFPDLKQPSQSHSISLSLGICKYVYFYLHSESISTECA